MTRFTLSDYEEKLNHQVIHMDQGLAYSPEFRATRNMTDYPSRKMQIARAIYKGELSASANAAKILNLSILSRQGERWQNFNEDPEDYTDCMILSRRMLADQGFNKDCIDEFIHLLNVNDGHLFPFSNTEIKKWQETIPMNDASSCYLLLDDASCAFVSGQSEMIGDFLSKKGLFCMKGVSPVFLGWEYFTLGMADEGIRYTEKMIAKFQQMKVKEIIVLSGQAEYFWKYFLPKIGLHHNFSILNLFDFTDQIKVPEKSFVYAGSFLTRYLMMGKKLNKMIKNQYQVILPCSEEFIPTYNADRRVNEVNIWQKPLGAEYKAFGLDEELKNKIFEDAYTDISLTPHKEIVVFEPYAYNLLKNKKRSEKIVYFTECLS